MVDSFSFSMLQARENFSVSPCCSIKIHWASSSRLVEHNSSFVIVGKQLNCLGHLKSFKQKFCGRWEKFSSSSSPKIMMMIYIGKQFCATQKHTHALWWCRPHADHDHDNNLILRWVFCCQAFGKVVICFETNNDNKKKKSNENMAKGFQWKWKKKDSSVS